VLSVNDFIWFTQIQLLSQINYNVLKHTLFSIELEFVLAGI